MLDELPPLTDFEKAYLEIQRRTITATKLIGLNAVDRLFITALIQTPETWTVSGLADYLYEPRSSTSRRVKMALARNIVEKVDGGIRVTDEGYYWCLRLMRETSQIAMGSRKGYTPEQFERYVTRHEMFGTKAPDRAALALSFPPLDVEGRYVD